MVITHLQLSYNYQLYIIESLIFKIKVINLQLFYEKILLYMCVHIYIDI